MGPPGDTLWTAGCFSTDTTVFVTTIGDQANFDGCLAHLECQTLGCHVEVIDRVVPMSAAFQQMHEQCKTPFYVQLDEDMILVPEAVQQLEERSGNRVLTWP